MSKALTIIAALACMTAGIGIERATRASHAFDAHRQPFGNYQFVDDAASEAGIDLIADGDCVEIARHHSDTFELRRC